jgi:hypothetical protein
MKNKSYLVGLGLFAAATLIAGPALAQATGGFANYVDNHGAAQITGGVSLVKMVAMLIGVILLVSSIIMVAMLAFEKAPPQLQQVGYKAPIIGIICGGLLTAITWFVGFAAATATGGQQDQDTWQRLNKSSSIIVPSAPGRETSSELYKLV